MSDPHIRDSGGPLLPGYTFNGSGRPEQVVPASSGGEQRPATVINLSSNHQWYVDGELGASSRRQLERMMDDRDQDLASMIEQRGDDEDPGGEDRPANQGG